MIKLSISNDITKFFKSVEVPFKNLGNITSNYNYSSSSYKDGYRKKSNVISIGNVIIFDFDDGSITIDEMEKYLKKNNVTAIIATTKSHQMEKNGKPKCDRYRLLIPFDEELKIDVSDYSLFYQFMSEILRIEKAIDPACKDSSRFYYPSKNQLVKYVETGTIFNAEFFYKNFIEYKNKKNIQDEINKKKKNFFKKNNYNSNYKNKVKQFNKKKLAKNEVLKTQQVITANGLVKELQDFEYLGVNDTVLIHCINPEHEDKHPSAFIGRSNNNDGRLLVKCHSCKKTYFIEKD